MLRTLVQPQLKTVPSPPFGFSLFGPPRWQSPGQDPSSHSLMGQGWAQHREKYLRGTKTCEMVLPSHTDARGTYQEGRRTAGLCSYQVPGWVGVLHGVPDPS